MLNSASELYFYLLIITTNELTLYLEILAGLVSLFNHFN